MLALPDERDVLKRLQEWGEAESGIRAMILTSSRTRPDRSADLLSDYDHLILALADVAEFTTDDRWMRGYGTLMVRWGDQHEVHGLPTYFRGVVYRDGVKVDYTLWPEALLDRVGETTLPEDLDVGYRVLLDEDGRTSAWPQPTYRAHIPAAPTQADYRALVEEFWWGTTYVAKSIWRGDLAFTKFVLDYDIKLVTFGRLLEWRIELDHDWSIKPGIMGVALSDCYRMTSDRSLRRPTSVSIPTTIGKHLLASAHSSGALPSKLETLSAMTIHSMSTKL